MSDYPLTKEEFDSIYTKVPRLTVEVIIQSEQGVALTKRSIEPCIGLWHLPGGTVYYGEPLIDTVKRIAKKELGITVKSMDMLGIIEYPEHVTSGYGDPRGIAFLVIDYDGEFQVSDEADDIQWFKSVPELMHPHQDEFLIEHQLLTRE